MNDNRLGQRENFWETNDREAAEDRLHNLKEKLIGFTVKNSDGATIGRVEDLILEPDGKLKLVVSRTISDRTSRRALVDTQLIQNIEYGTHSVFVLLTPQEWERLPAYERMMEQPAVDPSDLPPEWRNPTRVSEDRIAGITKDRDRSSDREVALVDSNGTRKEIIAENIPLREERLVVDRSKRKIGEVVVRKEIETRTIEVPVRREKLIVEKVSPEYQKLAEIDLGQAEIKTASIPQQGGNTTSPTINGEFTSPEIAARILYEIAKRDPHGCGQVRVEIELEDERFIETYQKWFDRYASPDPNS